MESYIEPFIGDVVTRTFTLTIAIIFVVAIFATRISTKWAARVVSTASGVLTSIGVLGTFVGIFIGLQHFDVADIEASVPNLLDGLKLSFATRSC